AVVCKRPLPYLYLAQQTFGAACLAYETSDGLPLAAEPFATAVDLVLDFIESGFAREPLVALLRSPHFSFGREGAPLDRASVGALDRALSDARYLGGLDRLSALTDSWVASGAVAAAAADSARDAAVRLSPLTTALPASQ